MTKEDVIFIASLFAGIALLIFICIKLDEASCLYKAQKMGYECDYSVYTGCMIRVNDKWIPFGSYRKLKEFL